MRSDEYYTMQCDVATNERDPQGRPGQVAVRFVLPGARIELYDADAWPAVRAALREAHQMRDADYARLDEARKALTLIGLQLAGGGSLELAHETLAGRVRALRRDLGLPPAEDDGNE